MNKGKCAVHMQKCHQEEGLHMPGYFGKRLLMSTVGTDEETAQEDIKRKEKKEKPAGSCL